MANKKNSNKKAKNIQTKKEIFKKETSDSREISKIIKYLAIVLIVIVIVYFLTVYITNHSSDSSYKKKVSAADIQTSKILAGTSFSQKESEYYVLYYDTSSNDSSTYSSLYSTYKEKEGHTPIYYVDLHEGLNKSYIGDVNTNSAEELKVKSPMLIKFIDNQVSEVKQDESEITNTLK